ncbi:MAG: hypothetical protein DMG14_05060 [Acidobacteria bacterium]|nr:MAG: hypothetical protein DMG14_05060 [Acidobacteriota bacterium]
MLMKKLLLVLLGLSLPLLGQTSLTPTLTSISPVSGNQGATLTVTLTGSGFTNPSSVLFSGNGVAVQSVRFVSATSLTATMALSAPAGAYTVRIATSGGTSGTQTFTILPSPITSATQLAVTTFAGQGSVGSADGPGAEATFAGPTNIWGDNTSLYISDSFNSVIRRISLSSGTVSTIAGSALRRGITDGTGANARFGVPLGIWGDGTNLYVADAVFDTIRKIVLDSGTVTTIAGSATDPSGSADGPGSTARFNSPGGVWGDGTNLYVADYSNYTIRKIVLATNTVSTIAGIAGSRGTEDGTGSAARFYAPEDLWGDGKNLYVADGSSIRQVNLTNVQVTTLAGNPSLRGYADGKASEARFTSPGGLWGMARIYTSPTVETTS